MTIGKTDFLFVHGGPGMNSQPERANLSVPLAKQGLSFAFFDEPSSLRPQGYKFDPSHAYQNWLKALDKEIEHRRPRVLVGLSFGALAVVHCLELFGAGSVEAILMAAPTLDMQRVFLTVMKISELDFAKTDPVKQGQLKAFREGSRKFWDPDMQNGLTLAWQNPSLLLHYTPNLNALQLWQQAYATPGYGLDFASQSAVLTDLATNPPAVKHPLHTPVHIIYGDQDPVFDLAETKAIIKQKGVPLVQVECYANCGHLPQLEFTDRFIQHLRQML